MMYIENIKVTFKTSYSIAGKTKNAKPTQHTDTMGEIILPYGMASEDLNKTIEALLETFQDHVTAEISFEASNL